MIMFRLCPIFLGGKAREGGREGGRGGGKEQRDQQEDAGGREGGRTARRARRNRGGKVGVWQDNVHVTQRQR
jgi:hypothetical protein